MQVQCMLHTVIDSRSTGCLSNAEPLALVPPAACRVWDIRTKVQVHCLSGHEDTVSAILAMPTDPQASVVWMIFVDAWMIGYWQQHAAALAEGSVHLAFPVQVVTGSHDKTVRLWDLRMGKTLATLTHHKKVW